jgi:F-type H+-transporting ATPase subunit delta
VSATATSRAKQASSEAQTYARAVFEVAFEDWLKGLQHVATTLDRSPGLVQSLADETQGFEARQAKLVAVLPEGMAKPVRNFLFGMLANGDMALLGDVVSQLRQMASASGGPQTTVAEVTSAVELTSEERSGIQQRLLDQYGAGLEFKFNVDPSILGGLVIRVGDKLLDDSVSSRLAALRQSLGVTSR